MVGVVDVVVGALVDVVSIFTVAVVCVAACKDDACVLDDALCVAAEEEQPEHAPVHRISPYRPNTARRHRGQPDRWRDRLLRLRPSRRTTNTKVAIPLRNIASTTVHTMPAPGNVMPITRCATTAPTCAVASKQLKVRRKRSEDGARLMRFLDTGCIMNAMMQLGKGALAAIAVTSMGLGAAGALVFAPTASSAAPSTTSPNSTGSAPNANGGSSSGFHSNEDPAHEKNESSQREAEENSGQFSGHCHHGWDNSGESGNGQSNNGNQSGQSGSSSAAPTGYYLP